MSYPICECKVVQVSGNLVYRKEREMCPTNLATASCLTCGQAWLFNAILDAWAHTWGPLGRAWMAGYSTVELHEEVMAQK